MKNIYIYPTNPSYFTTLTINMVIGIIKTGEAVCRDGENG